MPPKESSRGSIDQGSIVIDPRQFWLNACSMSREMAAARAFFIIA
jgi:hypothetical protein